MDALPTLPLAQILDQLVSWMHLNLAGFFSVISSFISIWESSLRAALLLLPPVAIVLLLSGWAFWKLGRSGALFILLSLMFIWNLGLWKATMYTFSQVLVASSIALGIGVPIGILVHQSHKVRAFVMPILDLMQTTPSFVYLIPNVLFFGTGSVPGIIATVMFAFPPPVRMTALGLDQVSPEVIEAGEAFGCSRWKLLCNVKLPLAMPSITLGINQCAMMSLSMVVIASLIGARGLGTNIIRSLTRVNAADGIEAGIAVVLVAMILDRISRGTVRTQKKGEWL